MRLLALPAAIGLISGLLVSGSASASQPSPEVTQAAYQGTSAPLRTMEGVAPDTVRSKAGATTKKPVPGSRKEAIADSNPGPPVIPDPTGPAPGGGQSPTQADGFDGISNEELGNIYYPPDTDGDIGPNHYVQIVNAAFAVYNRDGDRLLGPLNNKALWQGLGGPCATNNDGDPIVQYDQFADRWLLSQFAIGGGPPYYECVAVSKTADPTGAYNLYAFEYSDFPDYPKIGVWPDGYYVSYNMYTPTFSYAGAKVCALDRAAMINGDPATQVCFGAAEKPALDTEFSLLPSDVDGATAPPLGSPNYFVGESWDQQDELTMYLFDVDWSTPSNSTLSTAVSIPVYDFVWACVDPSLEGGLCVPQRDSTVRLDSLGGRAMYRLAYRNFGTHESLLMNHTVSMSTSTGLTSQTGVGWFEIRQPGGTPVVYQQGTSADPDGSTFRFMGSMAMDGDGNIALGYSKSSSASYAGIAYTGRLAGDPLNQMPQVEVPIMAGGGAQTGPRGRWGDYSAMQIDPVDDCTFWYTNEYIGSTSVKSWRTRIASFSFPSCLGRPERPATVTAIPGDEQAQVSWTAAAGNGSAVIDYTVTSTPASAGCKTASTSCTVLGLEPGRSYVFTVRATNANGTGPGEDSAPVTTYGPPGPASSVVAAAGNGLARVSWNAANPNGSAVLDYTVTSTPASAGCVTSTTTCTVAGLANGMPYTFTVTARNKYGSGDPASSASVTPVFDGGLVVSAPLLVKPGASLPVSVAGSSAVCQVSLSFNGKTTVVPISANGTGSASLTAPKPNDKYELTATQGGPACVGSSVSRQVTVKGVYLTGSTQIKKGSKQSFKAQQFIAGGQLTWKIKRNDTVKLKKTKTVSSSRTSKISYTFSKKGTYKVIASQANKNLKATMKVSVG